MKYNEYDDEFPKPILPRHIKITETINDRYRFIDKELKNPIEKSLDDLDFSFLDKSNNKDKPDNKVKTLKKDI